MSLYFLALQLAPPAEARLVAYLWPLLIVLLSSLLPGERLRSHHIVGALIALAGTVVLLVGRGGIGFAPAYLPGFAAAFVAAFTWAVYSVAVAPLRRCADRGGRRLLPRHRRAGRDLPCGVRADAIGRRARRSGSPCSPSASGRSGSRSTSGISA